MICWSYGLNAKPNLKLIDSTNKVKKNLIRISTIYFNVTKQMTIKQYIYDYLTSPIHGDFSFFLIDDDSPFLLIDDDDSSFLHLMVSLLLSKLIS